MSPRLWVSGGSSSRFPRVSGDEPGLEWDGVPRLEFSPRERG